MELNISLASFVCVSRLRAGAAGEGAGHQVRTKAAVTTAAKSIMWI